MWHIVIDYLCKTFYIDGAHAFFSLIFLFFNIFIFILFTWNVNYVLFWLIMFFKWFHVDILSFF